MNSAVVKFLDSIEKVNTIVESDVVGSTDVGISSYVPPFVRDEVLERELSRHGQLTVTTNWGNKKKSPLLKHVMSHRRQVHMIFKKDTDKPNLEF
ncbi:unnamed protein product [Oncorhynchus mykiss]|uniref:Uncharacterized protein n=1 Tax=Oncorhynchus mykiss TaxID=8022 RepID=A0A060XV01_ONCMY|nr:unnamed protein product [Oncorhynchus mykiss]